MACKGNQRVGERRARPKESGHSSIRITEKHDSTWVRARQEQLEADVAKTWKDDPLILAAGKGTPKVRENIQVVN